MKTLVTIDPRLHDAVIFDLDGVVTDTASIHAAAWAAMFDDFLQRRSANACENHTPFTDDDYRHFVDGKPRYDGVVDFLASRGISLPHGDPSDVVEDTVCGVGNRKQQRFLERVNAGVPVFESTVALVGKLAEAGVATAVYSSSRNCEQILDAAGLGDLFAVRVDGVVAEALGLPGKPEPSRPGGGHQQTGGDSGPGRGRRGCRGRSRGRPRRRVRTRHWRRPDRTCRQPPPARRRRGGFRPLRGRGAHRRQAHDAVAERTGVL